MAGEKATKLVFVKTSSVHFVDAEIAYRLEAQDDENILDETFENSAEITHDGVGVLSGDTNPEFSGGVAEGTLKYDADETITLTATDGGEPPITAATHELTTQSEPSDDAKSALGGASSGWR